MLRRAIEVLLAAGDSPFRTYYSNLLISNGEGAPTIDEAQRDYQRILESRYKHPLL